MGSLSSNATIETFIHFLCCSSVVLVSVTDMAIFVWILMSSNAPIVIILEMCGDYVLDCSLTALLASEA